MPARLLRPALVAAILSALPAAIALAQAPGVADLPERWQQPEGLAAPSAVAAAYAAADLGGSWRYRTADHAVIACDFPVFPLDPAAGALELAPHEGGVTVTLMTGGNCAPASMCIFEGSYDAGQLTLSNGATVDSEGGVAANGWTVVFTSLGSAEGIGHSVYVHPEGARCSWRYSVTLTRDGSDSAD